MEEENDVISRTLEKEIENRDRSFYFQKKIAQARQAEVDKAFEKELREEANEKRKQVIGNITFDFNGKPIVIKQSIGSGATLMPEVATYEFGGQMLAKGASTLSTLKKGSNNSLTSRRSS